MYRENIETILTLFLENLIKKHHFPKVTEIKFIILTLKDIENCIWHLRII